MATSEECTSKQTFCALGKQTASSNGFTLTYNPNNLQNTNITDTVWNSIIDKIVAIYNFGERGTRNPGINSGTWKKDDTGWWFEYTNGSYPKNAWIYEAGTYWHFNSSGYYDSKSTTKPSGTITYIFGPFSTDLTQPTDTSNKNETYNSAIVSNANRNTKHVADGNTVNLSAYNEILTSVGKATLSQSASDLTITAAKFNAIATAISAITLNDNRCNNCNVSCNTGCKAVNKCDSSCDGSCPGNTCFGCIHGGEGGAPCYIDCGSKR